VYVEATIDEADLFVANPYRIEIRGTIANVEITRFIRDNELVQLSKIPGEFNCDFDESLDELVVAAAKQSAYGKVFPLAGEQVAAVAITLKDGRFWICVSYSEGKSPFYE